MKPNPESFLLKIMLCLELQRVDFIFSLIKLASDLKTNVVVVQCGDINRLSDPAAVAIKIDAALPACSACRRS